MEFTIPHIHQEIGLGLCLDRTDVRTKEEKEADDKASLRAAKRLKNILKGLEPSFWDRIKSKVRNANIINRLKKLLSRHPKRS